MKQFFQKLFGLLGRRPGYAKIENPVPGINIKESRKEMRKRRLVEMYKATGLDYESSSVLAEHFGITITELVDYYHFFGHLPKPDYLIIIRSYGVRSLIAECETLIEN